MAPPSSSSSSSSSSLMKKRDSNSNSSGGVPELFKLVQSDTKVVVVLNWNKVFQRASTQPQEAHFVHPQTKFTALHQAIINKSTTATTATTTTTTKTKTKTTTTTTTTTGNRLQAIRALLLANPGAATAVCELHGYTPLAYACLNQDEDPEVIKLLLDFSPDCIHVRSKDGKAPLELHMKMMSLYMARHYRNNNNTNNNNNNNHHHTAASSSSSSSSTGEKVPDTAILSILASSSSSSSSGSNLSTSKVLETLFSYNTRVILEKLALEEAIASLTRLQARRQARLSSMSSSPSPSSPPPSSSSVLDKKDATTNTNTNNTTTTTNDYYYDVSSKSGFDNFWVWQWAQVILQKEHERRFHNNDIMEHKQHQQPPQASLPSPSSPPPFCPLLTASSIKDCPLPFLIMAVRATSPTPQQQQQQPQQIRQADVISGNLPLHNVAFWDAQEPDQVSRKSMALTVLAREYPKATQMKNKQGKTPFSLALETGTSWDNGVRCLTHKKELLASSHHHNPPHASSSSSSRKKDKKRNLKKESSKTTTTTKSDHRLSKEQPGVLPTFGVGSS